MKRLLAEARDANQANSDRKEKVLAQAWVQLAPEVLPVLVRWLGYLAFSLLKQVTLKLSDSHTDLATVFLTSGCQEWFERSHDVTAVLKYIFAQRQFLMRLEKKFNNVFVCKDIVDFNGRGIVDLRTPNTPAFKILGKILMNQLRDFFER